MPNHSVRASMLIRRRPADIFEAFVDPDLLCRFWLDAASPRLGPDVVAHWRFKVPGVEDTISVTRFEPPRNLTLKFSDGIQAALSFEMHDADATRVAVTCSGFDEDDLLAQATNTVEGFSIVLCDLKILLETGRSAHLVKDKAELIERAMADKPAR